MLPLLVSVPAGLEPEVLTPVGAPEMVPVFMTVRLPLPQERQTPVVPTTATGAV